ncbi:chalcone isomerase family protein [Marinifilum sp. D737]|uniref:chalcone isomerase family protein n=1 Tax=Marinifilum sp. D737 TaxID=2969628 RepID=UPI00227649F6|nr:chalcone isomerase family protein [Marinifilum sp. D737]MCY1634372.1 chalcone isomerase family protein [Marinifilum sp. D737]
MKKLFTLLLILSCFGSFAQTKVGGVELPSEIMVKETKLNLHGAGTRVKLWMDMYAMGLYLENKTSDASQIINADKSMGIRLEIISGLITAEKMEKATRDGFKNSTQNNTKPIESRINDFLSVFLSGVEKKDIFEFVYNPSEGSLIYKNGELKKVIDGLDFKKALFGIWLCNKPADKNLKEDLLK